MLLSYIFLKFLKRCFILYVILKILVAVYLTLTEIKVRRFFLTLFDVPINEVAMATVF